MSVLDDLEFIFFHLMPYAPLPDGYKEADSLWVDYPNSNFDPVTGHELYKRYWSELLLADKLGYDGVFVNEHHNTQFTMNAAPNLTAAAIIRTPHVVSACSGHPRTSSIPTVSPRSTRCST